MAIHQVTVFEPYPFSIGQKIRIDSGPRQGDWEVIGVTEAKVKLKCPISFKEFEWPIFCYQVGDKEQSWPMDD